MRLLLDEHYSRRIAEQLRSMGHDVVSTKERPDLVGLADRDLFGLMAAEQRAILTENWGDFAPLAEEAADSALPHAGIVFTSRQRFPRSRNTIGLYVEALDAFLSAHPGDDALRDASHWL